ncbi:MAG TPA: hypothetical protein DCG49_04820 [Ruminococcus sp.]|nr:hypothetical protein [Ruminococcus sp.]
MKCPNCGEPITTRHTFCVICHTDLKDFLENPPPKKTEAIQTACKRVHAVLTKPIGKPRPEQPGKQTEQGEQNAVISEILPHSAS